MSTTAPAQTPLVASSPPANTSNTQYSAIPLYNSTTPVGTTNSGTSFFSWIWFIFLIIYLIIWFSSGVAAFVASFICLGYQGSTSDKIVGIMIALLFGPLYWLYFSLNKNYCYSGVSVNHQQQQMSDF